MRIPALLTCLLLVAPATAQETPTFTPEDAELMTACIEGLSGTPEEPASHTDCIGAASNPCMENQEGGSTTIGMTECMGRETAWWDSQLNVHYASLKESLGPDLFASLRDAQRAWIAYRDASCGFEYDLWSEGTIRSIVFASCMLDQTARRATALEGYANRTP